MAAKKTSPRTAVPSGPVPFTKDQDLEAYREMLLIRRFEEKAGQMYGMGLIGGFCHLYIGQEAVVDRHADGLGRNRATRPSPDTATTATCSSCGMDAEGRDGRADRPPRRVCPSGKGGSMHMFSKEKQFFGGHGIVGAQVSLGTGLGFADRLQEERQSQP